MRGQAPRARPRSSATCSCSRCRIAPCRRSEGSREAIKGKVLIDASNPIVPRDGEIGDVGARERRRRRVAELLPGARSCAPSMRSVTRSCRSSPAVPGTGMPIAGDDPRHRDRLAPHPRDRPRARPDRPAHDGQVSDSWNSSGRRAFAGRDKENRGDAEVRGRARRSRGPSRRRAPPSFHLDVRFLDHLAPRGTSRASCCRSSSGVPGSGVAPNVSRRSRTSARSSIARISALSFFTIAGGVLERRIHAEPAAGIEAVQRGNARFGERRHVRKYRAALCGAHGDRMQGAALMCGTSTRMLSIATWIRPPSRSGIIAPVPL